MRYLAPATLFGHTPDLADKRSLLLEKKKLLTEFELSDDGQLTINGRTLGKNDVLEYFETLEDAKTISYHQAIGRDKTLSRFLETARIPLGATFTESGRYADAGFIQWISPYFYTAFTDAAKYYFQKTDEQGLKDLLANPLLLTDYDRERAWFSIIQLLEGNIALLENYHRAAIRAKGNLDVDPILPLISQPLLTMILLLPKGTFTQVRDNYAFVVMQLSILLFNKNRWRRELAQAWIYRANTLAASDRMYQQVTNKAHQMSTIDSKGSYGSWGIRAAIVIGIVVLNALFRANGCHSSAGSHDQQFYTQLTITPCANRPPDSGFHLRSQ